MWRALDSKNSSAQQFSLFSIFLACTRLWAMHFCHFKTPGLFVFVSSLPLRLRSAIVAPLPHQHARLLPLVERIRTRTLFARRKALFVLISDGSSCDFALVFFFFVVCGGLSTRTPRILQHFCSTTYPTESFRSCFSRWLQEIGGSLFTLSLPMSNAAKL
jgi:hypothetical protein